MAESEISDQPAGNNNKENGCGKIGASEQQKCDMVEVDAVQQA